MKTDIKEASKVIEPEDIQGPMIMSAPWTEEERTEIQEFIAKDKANQRKALAENVKSSNQ